MHDQSIIDNEISKAFKFVNENKLDEAKQSLDTILKTQESLQTNQFQNIADIYLIIGEFKIAGDMYIKANNLTGHAFTLILLKKIEEAKEALILTEDSQAKLWCEFLIELFTEKNNIQKWPGYFTIRHFLESTFYLLLKSTNEGYINLLIKISNELLDINPDSEKYIGYAYVNFEDLHSATPFLERALKRNSYDGEIYFVLGKALFNKGLLPNALAMLENARLLLPEHMPTKMLLEEVKASLKPN